MNADGSVRNGRVFHTLTGSEAGVADGMKCDQEGNVYCTGPGGIHVMDTEGKLIGRLRIPGHATNLAWGDDDWSLALRHHLPLRVSHPAENSRRAGVADVILRQVARPGQ